MCSVLYREVKCTVSFIERLNVQCPLYEWSFKRGFTLLVFITMTIKLKG